MASVLPVRLDGCSTAGAACGYGVRAQLMIIVAVCLIASFSRAMTTSAAGPAVLVREAVELAARRSGREIVGTTARESLEQTVEIAVRRHGPAAAAAVADGGIELIEAGGRYGDELLRVAVGVGPAARRTLALDPGNLMPLVRELGPEALELEAKSPGISRRVAATFGPGGARRLATTPAEDMPRLVSYAERADTPQTRRMLLEAYEKEGPSLFSRIPPSLVLAGGLTASMILGTHRATTPLVAVGDRIASDPELARRAIDWLAVIGAGIAVIVVYAILRGLQLLMPRGASAGAGTRPDSSDERRRR